MTEQPEKIDWTDLVERARARIAAAPRDKNAALHVVGQSAVALRDLVRHDLLPDPMRMEYLRALLAALELIEAGEDPVKALHLSQGHRIRDEKLWSRNFILFIETGREFDRRKSRGHTREDKPIQEAQRAVSKLKKLPLATIQKVWHSNGGEAGWNDLRPVIDSEPD